MHMYLWDQNSETHEDKRNGRLSLHLHMCVASIEPKDVTFYFSILARQPGAGRPHPGRHSDEQPGLCPGTFPAEAPLEGKPVKAAFVKLAQHFINSRMGGSTASSQE